MNNMPPAVVKKWFHRTHDYFVDRDLGSIELHPPRQMNNDRIHKQIRSLLTRWGYKPIDLTDSLWDKYELPATANRVWLYPERERTLGSRFDTICNDLAATHDLPIDIVRRLIEAEPVDQDLGSIELHPQPLTEWGDREDHAEATIVLDAHGRDQLIAALIEGKDSIEVHGESGGGYTLNLQIKSAE